MYFRISLIQIFLLIGFLTTQKAEGFTVDPDSLENVLSGATKYQNRFNTLHELHKYHLYTNPEKSKGYLRNMLQTARQEGDSAGVADTYMLMSALASLQGNFEDALRYDKRYLEINESGGDQNNIAQGLNNIGDDYMNMGLYNDAYDYYQRSRKLAKEIGNNLITAVASYNVGTVLKEMGQIRQAKFYINESMELSRSIDDVAGIAYSLKDLGEIYRIEEDYPRSLNSLRESLALVDSLELSELKPEIYQILAETYCSVDSIAQSMEYYQMSLDIYTNLGNNKGIGQNYLGMGRLMIDMDQVNAAEDYLEKALAMALGGNYGELARDAYQELSVLYEKRGNFQEALRLHKKLKVLEDSLFSTRKNEQFAQLQLLHETEQKDAEIRLMREHMSNEEFKSNVLVVILALAAVILFNLYRSSVRRKKINSLLLAHQKEIEEKSREMEGLLEMKDKFFSIISHDLRSPINGLVGLLDMLHEGQISQQELSEVTRSLKNRLKNTRELLDNLLDWALVQMDQFSVKEEVLDLREVTGENLAFFREINDKHVHLFNKIEKDTRILADHNMINLVIRNLLSNSIKFTDEEGTILVSAVDGPGEFITVSIEDSGIGMTREQAENLFDNKSLYSTRGTANERGTGLGLKLCQEFVERMGGQIWVESRKDVGSTFKFTLKKANSQ